MSDHVNTNAQVELDWSDCIDPMLLDFDRNPFIETSDWAGVADDAAQLRPVTNEMIWVGGHVETGDDAIFHLPGEHQPQAHITTAGERPPRQRHRHDEHLKCPHGDCKHTGTFRRQYELDRHIRVKHHREKPFVCPFPGCFTGPKKTCFARSDKLTAHIRAVHARHGNVLLECPVSGCSNEPMELDLLSVHLRKAHPYSEKNAIINAASSDRLQCPVWDCPSTVKTTAFLQHLIQHSTAELESVELKLQERNYILVKGRAPSIGLAFHQSGSTAYHESIAEVRVRCPVCKATFDNHLAFELHFDDAHVIAVNERSHYHAWRNFLVAELATYEQQLTGKPWAIWLWHRSGWGDLRCPFCGLTLDWGSESSHHKEMLADNDDIKPFRREVLKLYPEFHSHPVWDDLA